MSVPDLAITVETITSMYAGTLIGGGQVCPPLETQQAGVSPCCVAFGWQTWICETGSASPMKLRFVWYSPCNTWVSHLEPQKLTRWPSFSPAVLPPQITKEVER